MFTLSELAAFLADNDCDFEIIAHSSPIISTKDAVKYFDLDKAAPTYILKTEKGLIALVVSSGRGRLDFSAMKEKWGFSKMKLADLAEVRENTGYHVGAIPLIGHNLPLIFDKKLLDFDYVYGGSGDALHTLKIAPRDIVRFNRTVTFI